MFRAEVTASRSMRKPRLSLSLWCCTRAHPDLNQGPADLQSAALTTELCTHATSAAVINSWECRCVLPQSVVRRVHCACNGQLSVPGQRVATRAHMRASESAMAHGLVCVVVCASRMARQGVAVTCRVVSVVDRVHELLAVHTPPGEGTPGFEPGTC